MISYAQNCEDVVLSRALGSGPGFYVDVGAADPDVASVTRHFYELGWRGINIDPRADAISSLDEKRPRDVNLCLAAGAMDGEVEFSRNLSDPDLSTFAPDTRAGWSDEDRADQIVEVRRLDSILDQYVDGEIDFLKIDVEGAERDVLEGIDLGRWRPTVVVVEAVRPYSIERTDAEWRHLLELSGYEEGCFDGINLFFARSDRPDVLVKLFPANALDRYTLASVDLMQSELSAVREYVNRIESDWKQKVDQVAELESEITRLSQRRSGRWVGSRGYQPIGCRSADESPVGAAGGHTPRSRTTTPPAKPARIAIVGTPMSGNSWLRRALAEYFACADRAVDHPGDVRWQDLEPSCVMQIEWPRSAHLEAVLRRNAFTVVSPARHPIDVLIAMWCGRPGSSERRTASEVREANRVGVDADGVATFEEWAISGPIPRLLTITPSWWRSPSTVRIRYESMLSNPVEAVEQVLRDAQWEPGTDTCAR